MKKNDGKIKVLKGRNKRNPYRGPCMPIFNV